jgi:hypothetical protein
MVLKVHTKICQIKLNFGTHQSSVTSTLHEAQFNSNK